MSTQIALAHLQHRGYDKKNYNCSHFVREAWFVLTDVDIVGLVDAWNSGDLKQAMAKRTDLVRLDKPQDPCIVMFFQHDGPPHVGIWCQHDMVIHNTDQGVVCQRMAMVTPLYKSHKFYLCQP